MLEYFGMENQTCIFLGIKVKPGPIERFKIENFDLDNTVNNLKNEAEKKANVPSISLELIHHGKILKDDFTLNDSGIKNGEMVHVVRKKSQAPAVPPPTYTDAELQQLNTALRSLGCSPNASGWTRAMQLLNDESAMSEILEQAPALADDCVALSILHEVELVAALGATVQSMRRGATAHPSLPTALTALTHLVHSRDDTSPTTDNAPVSGFAYSLEALSEDEDAEEEVERPAITQEQLAAALQAATEAVASPSSRGNDGLLRLLRESRSSGDPASPTTGSAGGSRGTITPAMLGAAISEAITRTAPDTQTPTEPTVTAAPSSSQSGPRDEDFSSQLQHMHEMGLLDDALNVRALLICSGDVNAAINLVFSGAIGDD